jgi:hypothetical protein
VLNHVVDMEDGWVVNERPPTKFDDQPTETSKGLVGMRHSISKMIKIARLAAVTVSALTPTGTVVRAQAEREFLRPAQAAKMLADSRPWAATRADGREAKVTFNPDGTGMFEGPMTLSTKWTINGDDICITMTVIGVKCHRFAKVSGGLDGYLDGAVDLRLRR